MGLYVDHYRAHLGRMRMSHLMADTSEELQSACRTLGLKLSYIHGDHLDVSDSKRAIAIKELGAVEVSSRALVELRRGARASAQ